MKKSLSGVSVIAFILVFAGISFAGSATGSLGVSATVVGVCTVSTSPVNFGDVTGTAIVNIDGDITVNCPVGQLYYIALDAGLHYTTERQMVGGSYSAQYFIALPDYSMTWGDVGYANTVNAPPLADTGTGTDQPHPVHASMSTFSGIPSGTVLMDTVTVTVHY